MGWTEEDLKKKGFDKNGNKILKPFTETVTIKIKKKQPKIVEDIIIPEEFSGSIWIPGNVPSSKNSRQNFVKHQNDVLVRKSNGKIDSISLGSKLVQEYKKKTEIYWIREQEQFQFHKMQPGKFGEQRQEPFEIQFLFVRDSKRKADFHNLVQLPLDLMQEYGWIEDDDMDHILPFPPLGPVKYIINKQMPGVFIQIRKS